MSDKRISFVFYQTPGGSEPVKEWLKSLDFADRKIIGEDLRTIEYGFPIGMPTCRPLGNGLWECRSNLTQRRIARVIFCIDGDKMIALHGFIKKTQQTPPKDLDLANRRRKEAGI